MREEINEHMRREPYVPFRITLTSGQSYDVSNPSVIAMRESLMHIFFPRSNRYASLRMNQTASIELLEPVN
jgi:hypothetical protein